MKGYQNNCIYRVKVVVKPGDERCGSPYLQFQHPVAVGESPIDGWMRHSSSADTVNDAPDRDIDWEDLSRHTTKTDCWIVLNGKVYDVTKGLDQHPGGVGPILAMAGKDATQEFESIHDDAARIMAKQFCIGKIKGYQPTGQQTRQVANPDETVLKPDRWVPCHLVRKVVLSTDTRRFTFQVPYKNRRLGLPVGKHLRIGVHFKDKMVVRSYTPTRPIIQDEDDGSFDLVVKIYFPQKDPFYPPGGIISNFLDTMIDGDTIDVKGLEGMIEYDGNGNFNIAGTDMHFDELAMVAGGTGITPLYQLIHCIAKNDSDHTKMSLIFANKTVVDILLREEFDALGRDHPDQFRLCYGVEKEPEHGKDNDDDVQAVKEGRMHAGHV
jgi:nitrate reductase (NAD(P)H)